MATLRKRTATVKIYGFDDANAVANKDYAVFTFTYPETFMYFKISGVDNEAPNSCYIRIYGISKDTYTKFENQNFKQFNITQKCDIYIGYDKEEELVWNGVVSRVKYDFNFGQQYIEILLTQSTSKFHIQKHSICIQKETNVYEAIGILCDNFGYKFQCQNIDDFQNLTLKPTTLEGNFRQCLADLLNGKMAYYVDNDTLITYSTDSYIRKEYILLFDNGLVTYPILDTGKLDEGDVYTITHKVIPSMRAGARIKIPVDIQGNYAPINTGQYVTFEVDEFITEFSNTNDSTVMKCRRVD